MVRDATVSGSTGGTTARTPKSILLEGGALITTATVGVLGKQGSGGNAEKAEESGALQTSQHLALSSCSFSLDLVSPPESTEGARLR